MKKLFFLFIPIFLIMIVSAKAYTVIDDCTYDYALNVSDTYKLTVDLTTAGVCDVQTACIYINGSDITLDLGGNNLTDGGGCQYGIQVLSKDPNPLEQWNNIIIKNGHVSGFNNAQIRVQGSTNNMEMTNLNLLGTDSEGIRAEGLNTNMNIHNNIIDTGNDYGIFLSGYSGYNTIQDNSLYSWDGIYLSGLGFLIQNNKIGSYYDNNQIKYYTNNASCIKYETPVDTPFTLDTVYNATIRKNTIIADNPMTIVDGININITQNEWLKIPNNYVLMIDDGTTDTAFCNNIITETINSGVFYYSNAFGQTLYSYCYWSKNSINAYNHVQNLGSGNTIQSYCTGGLGGGCIQGYSCENDTRVYYDSSCTVTGRWSCEYGCQENVCIGEQTTYTTTTTTTPSISTTIPLTYNKTSMYDPIIDRNDLNEVNLGWSIPFLTPFFLVLTGVMVGSAVITGVTKSIMVFPIMMIVFMLIFGVFGIIDWWISGVIIIFGVLGVAGILKSQTTG